jgi:hypothetical protein
MIGTDDDLPGDFEQLITPGIRPGDLYIGASSVHGRGVFASRGFRSAEIVEVCPVIIVPAAQLAALNTTLIFEYYYRWEDGAGVALGFGSLYNHSLEPNAIYRQHTDRGLVIVSALGAIAAGDEITINYNGEPADQTPVQHGQR